jgi:hypothetical protein
VESLRFLRGNVLPHSVYMALHWTLEGVVRK